MPVWLHPVPGPIAIDFKRQHTQPVVQQVALRSEGEGRVVGREGVADAIAATELDAFPRLANQLKPLESRSKLRRQPLHKRALIELLAFDGDR